MEPTKLFFGIFCLSMTGLFPSLVESREYSIDAFQLRGAMRFQDQWQFSIRNTVIESSFWLELGASSNGLKAVKFDPESELLTLVYKGSSYDMKMLSPEMKPIRVVRSTTSSVAPTGSGEVEIPQVPMRVPPPPPNNGLPPKLPAPSAPPKRLPAPR